MSAGPSATPWWRTAVIYQVYVRSFADSDGDGIGDLAGVRSRLTYIADLGVDAIWLNPFYPSPQADAGYDVSDHRGVDPTFGTLADFDGLVADAHDLGLRVIIDLVPNHTSSEHPWFRAALAAGPASAERARYLFRGGRGEQGDEAPNDWLSVFGGSAWTRVDESPAGADSQWYLHLFAPEQPDLDWANDEVRAEFASILRFWLDRGIDGFRIDVAHGLVKDPEMPDLAGNYKASGPATKAIPTGTATTCTRSTGSGGGSATRTRATSPSWARRGLRLRKARIADGPLVWLDAGGDVLVFTHGPAFGCVTNLADEPVGVPIDGEVVCASGPLGADGRIPGSTTVWYRLIHRPLT